ncbi:hypothetical protein [Fusobacterium ulcerans]|uniref:hypothetical protein n=1 Tax=Fusobacterium ulcerans TaxID=861 RepID=UPI001D09C3B9|nr:hypothetical protein [Fusobacterium ulcerans]MCB8566323.1 hypothetical protein [Fusobacterium ulcerans]MCB8650374.1 hypothetical protein [Fusobacterium ulcerans]
MKYITREEKVLNIVIAIIFNVSIYILINLYDLKYKSLYMIALNIFLILMWYGLFATSKSIEEESKISKEKEEKLLEIKLSFIKNIMVDEKVKEFEKVLNILPEEDKSDFIKSVYENLITEKIEELAPMKGEDD